MPDDSQKQDVPLGDMFSEERAEAEKAQEEARRTARKGKEATAKPDDNKKEPEDPNAPAFGNPRYRSARRGETVAEFKARMLEQLTRGRKKAARKRAQEKREREEKKRLKDLRMTERRLAEAEKLQEAIDRARARGIAEVDLVADILWVYENIDAKQSEWTGAPSKGALGLLGWAKKERKEFYNKMVVRALVMQEARERAVREKEQKEAAEEEEKNKEGKELDLPLSEVERLLRKFAGEEIKETDHDREQG